jgi:hypothetical protein
MNTFTIKLGSFIALIALTIPTGAQAYRFVESSSVQITDTTYLLTHTYTAGFLNENVQTPIVATSDYEAQGEYPRVGFSIEGVSEAALQGAIVNSLVLSNASIVDNRYQTMAGKRDTFTLVALVTMQNSISTTNNPALLVQQLPFSYTQNGEEKTGSYNLEVAAAEEDEIVISVGK